MYPIRDVVRPAVLTGQRNGLLAATILAQTPGLAGGPTVRLVGPAMRAWKALTAAALTGGHALEATSAQDSYRTYAVQESTFRGRYTTDVLPGQPSVLWAGRRWYQRPDTATAAVPGTSNHGWGLAVDVSGVGAHLPWLIDHAVTYGWSWELQSELWHLRYTDGDAIPPAVIAYEVEEAMPDATVLAIDERTDAILTGADPAKFKASDGTARSQPNELHRKLDALATQLNALTAMVAKLVPAGGVAPHAHQFPPALSGPGVPVVQSPPS